MDLAIRCGYGCKMFHLGLHGCSAVQGQHGRQVGFCIGCLKKNTQGIAGETQHITAMCVDLADQSFKNLIEQTGQHFGALACSQVAAQGLGQRGEAGNIGKHAGAVAFCRQCGAARQRQAAAAR